MPIEFNYSKGHKVLIGGKERAFVADFKRLLNKKNFAEMFGLCEYLGDDFEGTCKITMGSANINLKPKDVRQPSTKVASLTNLSRHSILKA